MGLLERLFGGKKEGAGQGPESAQFRDEEAATDVSPRNTPRRELMHVVLRDTMRKHGIPSDWIECRMLSVVSARRGSGIHLQLVVRQGDDRLLPYVHAFQESFVQELERFEPKAADWLFSLSWQFEGRAVAKSMPPLAGADPATPAAAPPADVAEPKDAELQEDLKALFAIRDAVLNAPPGREYPEFQPTQPGLPDEDDEPRGKGRQ